MAENPWQVESIKAFYYLKCPECQYHTKEENLFENHAVENHPLSNVFFENKTVTKLFDTKSKSLSISGIESENSDILEEAVKILEFPSVDDFLEDLSVDKNNGDIPFHDREKSDAVCKTNEIINSVESFANHFQGSREFLAIKNQNTENEKEPVDKIPSDSIIFGQNPSLSKNSLSPYHDREKDEEENSKKHSIESAISPIPASPLEGSQEFLAIKNPINNLLEENKKILCVFEETKTCNDDLVNSVHEGKSAVIVKKNINDLAEGILSAFEDVESSNDHDLSVQEEENPTQLKKLVIELHEGKTVIRLSSIEISSTILYAI